MQHFIGAELAGSPRRDDPVSRGDTRGDSCGRGSGRELHAHVHRACPTQGLGLQAGLHWSRHAQEKPRLLHGGGGWFTSTALQVLGEVFLYGL